MKAVNAGGNLSCTVSAHVSPPAKWVTVFETAGIDEAALLLQPLGDVLVSVLEKKMTEVTK